MSHRPQKTRAERVGSEIQKRLAQIIQFEFQDPRFTDFVTVSEVRVSPDLSYAKVYIARVGGTPADLDAFLAPFKDSVPFFRKRLAKEVKLRVVPELNFVYDVSLEYSDRLSQLIDNSIKADESKHSNEDE